MQKKYALLSGLGLQIVTLRKVNAHPDPLNCNMNHSAMTKSCKNVSLQAEEWIAKGDYIVKELEALYMLKKYRTLKRRYYKEE